jgi:hypothetical protein
MKNNNNKKKTKIKKQEEGWLPWLPWGWPATPILAKGATPLAGLGWLNHLMAQKKKKKKKIDGFWPLGVA